MARRAAPRSNPSASPGIPAQAQPSPTDRPAWRVGQNVWCFSGEADIAARYITNPKPWTIIQIDHTEDGKPYAKFQETLTGVPLPQCILAEDPDAPDLLQAALAYAARGWPVLPLHDVTRGACSCGTPDCEKAAGKHPRIATWRQDASADPAQIRRWWQDWPEANIGLVTGERSRLAVLDVDPRNGGDMALEDLQQCYAALPETPLVLTGGQGFHHYFALGGPLAGFHPGDGIELQADGQYVVAPPSLHASRTRYEWEASSGLEDFPLAPLPDWLQALAEDHASASSAGVDVPATLPAVEVQQLTVSHRIKYVIQTGDDPDDPDRYPSRSEALFAVIQAMIAAQYADATIASVIMDKRYRISEKVWSQKNPRSPLYDAQTRHWVAGEIGHARAKHSPPVTAAPSLVISAGADAHERPLPYSDYTNALAFIRDHGADVRYCYRWNAWLVWTGTHWERDTSGEVMRRAKDTIKRLARQVEHLGESEAKALLSHIKASLSTAKLKALVENAQSEPGIPTQPDTWDADPWLLNCANGTLELKTGTLWPHHRSDYLSKCLAIEYQPTATCPTWDNFLWRIMGGSQGDDDPDMSVGELENRRQADARATELIAYLQRAAGYTLTGSTEEQCLFLCHGQTKTGKSTYLATIRALLGPYGTQADIQTFMHKDKPEVRNDLADLAGSRYVYAVESQEGKRLAEALVKQMTGGVDAIKARFLFEEYFEFKPQFKAYIGTNHKPIIKDSDDAIWERIRLVPFVIQIPKEDRDKTLEEKLLQELPGILTWAVRGCQAWRASHDLKEPAAVVDATHTYRTEMDNFGRFLEECCLVNAAVRVKTGDLYAAYKKWCESIGEHALSLTAMGKRLDEQGFDKKVSGGIWRLGLGLAQAGGT
jgi:putative DNA primase/helicase